MVKKESKETASKKPRSRRNGGPENALCNHKGVRQRTSQMGLFLTYSHIIHSFNQVSIYIFTLKTSVS